MTPFSTTGNLRFAHPLHQQRRWHVLFDMPGDPSRATRALVQIIFHDRYVSMNPRMRAFDVLEVGLAALQPSLTVADRRQRLQRLADQVGLRQDALLRYPHEFSGGQRQRIDYTRTLLAAEPRLFDARTLPSGEPQAGRPSFQLQ